MSTQAPSAVLDRIRRHLVALKLPTAHSGDREHRFHAMVNSAWSRQLEGSFLRQVFTIRQDGRAV
jgi:hypothetical protein